MAPADKVGLGKAFMVDLLARIPEEARATPESLLAALQDDTLAAVVGEGTIRQQDYSREMNATQAWHKQLDEWYAANKAKLEAPQTPSNPQTPSVPAGTPAGLTQKEIDEQLNERERGQLAFLLAKDKLRDSHLAMFNEALDVQQLVTDPDINKLGLAGVYEKQFGGKIAEKRKAADDARIEAAREEGRREGRSAAHAGPPYPVASSFVSPLDALAPSAGISDAVVDKAVALHNQLTMDRLRPSS